MGLFFRVKERGDLLRCGEATVGVLRESTGEDGFARLRASHGSCVGESSRGRTDSFAFFFSLGKRKIKVSIPSSRDRATVHRTVAFYFSNPPPNAEKDQSERIGLFLVGEDGFEPSKRNAADLQSVPFGHSGTPPYSVHSPVGAGRRTRTPDLLITNQLLYQLSYTGKRTERTHYTM